GFWPPAKIGQPYSTAAAPAALGCWGGIAPYTWSAINSTINVPWPDGMTLSPDGVLSGTPTVSTDGDAKPSVARRGTDRHDQPVAKRNSRPIIQPSSDRERGEAPYTWSMVSGGLPDGLVLSPDGVLSGTPTTQGRRSFAVQVTDSAAGTPQTTVND